MLTIVTSRHTIK